MAGFIRREPADENDHPSGESAVVVLAQPCAHATGVLLIITCLE